MINKWTESDKTTEEIADCEIHLLSLTQSLSSFNS